MRGAVPRVPAAHILVLALALAIIAFQGQSFEGMAQDGVGATSSNNTPQMNQDSRVVAVLFSVGRTENSRKQFRDISNLDLLKVNGMPMISHVYDALCQSRYVQKIIVVAAPEIKDVLDVRDRPETSFVIDRGDAAENVEIGIDEISRNDLIMFIPSDLVLVTSRGLDDLIERVMAEKGVDIFFPIVSREACEKKYPEERRTYANFEEGQYTGAHVEFLRPNLFLDHVNEVAAGKDKLYDLYHMRRNALGMMRFLGIKLTLKYIFGTLSMHDVEKQVYEKYHVTAKAIRWDDPDLSTDLSEPRDIQMIQRALDRRGLAQSQIRSSNREPPPQQCAGSGA